MPFLVPSRQPASSVILEVRVEVPSLVDEDRALEDNDSGDGEGDGALLGSHVTGSQGTSNVMATKSSVSPVGKLQAAHKLG
mmetsp:Transcript_4754/g.9874  ORF Transcript_4754/g.9874 Transcript_4754/m.9874 type:complete len:81 (+) Transcript_4754:437-679(+)